MKTKTFRIEKNIKMPAISKVVTNGAPSMAAVTLALLEKGDSFLVRDALEAERSYKVMRGMNSRRRGELGFASRKVKGGMRFWRVK